MDTVYKPLYKGHDLQSQYNSYHTFQPPKEETSLQRTNQLNLCCPQSVLYSEVLLNYICQNHIWGSIQYMVRNYIARSIFLYVDDSMNIAIHLISLLFHQYVRTSSPMGSTTSVVYHTYVCRRVHLLQYLDCDQQGIYCIMYCMYVCT